MPHPTLHDFIEHSGMFFEGSGLPGTSGRIMGYLLVCDPPEQSSKQLAEGLETTSGSISTNTRLLLQVGLIERVPVRGKRGLYFRMTKDAFTGMMEAKMSQTRAYREILEEGLQAMGALGLDDDRRARLQDTRDLYAFFEAEFPRLLQRWQDRDRG